MRRILDEYKGKKVRNINFDDPESDFRNLGKFISESGKVNLMFEGTYFSDENDYGFNIYIANYDDTKAIRIFKDCNKLTYKYVSHTEQIDVIKLQERQPNIKLSKLPTGIVTMEDRIIGNEAPYFKDEYTIAEEIAGGMSKEDAIHYVYCILEALKELQDNGILYLDAHLKNFLINHENRHVDTIDFDFHYLDIFDDEYLPSKYVAMITNIKEKVIAPIFKYYEIDAEYKDIESLEELMNLVDSIKVSKKL